MRILAIRGCNLASLEGEFEIDFSAEPLRSTGIFAITGSTGSGKSTILDAVCLALFNDTPRISKAESGSIVDAHESTLSLGDSRNILRRGTGAGYAEVDFVALSGDKYRSRWSVRRARDKANGSMQAWSIELTNITSGVIQQGTKTELLSTIKRLIGLNFEQFTRAVMLAQGDFATFLKAGKNEKADLLEKLTGTDIYSRISMKIYENTQEAKSNLAVIERNIEGVELLTDDELNILNEELQTVGRDIKDLELQEQIHNKKIEWLVTEERLLKSIALAQEELDKGNASLSEAKPRFDYLARLDSVQEIRDDFKALEAIRPQLKVAQENMKLQQSAYEENNVKLATAQEAVNVSTQKKDEVEKELQVIRPQFIKARELDTQISGLRKSLKDAKQEVEKMNKQRTTIQTSMIKVAEELERDTINLNKLSEWFDINMCYADIVSRYELVINYIKDVNNAKRMADNNVNQSVRVEDLLKKDNKRLEDLHVEEERLNALLPTEIATLRLRLVFGEPCPVCGSIEHPINSEVGDSLAEEELTKAKEQTAEDIKRVENDIKNRRDELVSLESVIKTYRKQYSESYKCLEDVLNVFDDWKDFFEKNKLDEYIRNFVEQWQTNETKQVALLESEKLKRQKLKDFDERLREVDSSLKDRGAKVDELVREFEGLNVDRKILFNGESVDIVESRLVKKNDEFVELFNRAVLDYNNLVVRSKELEGAIIQIKNDIVQAESKEQIVELRVDEWLKNREDMLTLDALALLLKNDSAWIVSERKELDLLKSNITTAKTILDERRKNYELHKSGASELLENDTKELLMEAKEFTAKELVIKRERGTEINVALVNHKNGKERIKAFEKELEKKREVVNNWEKLNVLFGSSDGAKFKTIAQGYTLDVLLGYANKHLSDISDRYLLERVSTDSLSLQVRDLDMFSEVRSVHSLSGGESFLISLALALGLSSLSSSRMRVESLFIDEGFGTLDVDTLRVAMDVLERLQVQGRKIGVISHVAEMTERISTQIQVVKTTNGKSHIEISGS